MRSSALHGPASPVQSLALAAVVTKAPARHRGLLQNFEAAGFAGCLCPSREEGGRGGWRRPPGFPSLGVASPPRPVTRQRHVLCGPSPAALVRSQVRTAPWHAGHEPLAHTLKSLLGRRRGGEHWECCEADPRQVPHPHGAALNFSEPRASVQPAGLGSPAGVGLWGRGR